MSLAVLLLRIYEVVLAIHGDANDVVIKEVEIATSMLTTVTTHQLQGYVFLSF